MPKNPTEKSSKSNTANLLNGNGGKCKTNFVQRKNLNLKDKKNQNEVPEVVDEGNVQNLPLQSFNVAEKSVSKVSVLNLIIIYISKEFRILKR